MDPLMEASKEASKQVVKTMEGQTLAWIIPALLACSMIYLWFKTHLIYA